jgi:hypothetical protein
MDSANPVVFHFDGDGDSDLSKAWLQTFIVSANSHDGLRVTAEQPHT